jgi:hypothetical protein
MSQELQKQSIKDKTEKTIVWEFKLFNGETVTVTYHPRWFYFYDNQLQSRTDHVELRGKSVSPTGYNSQFINVNPDPNFDGEKEAYALIKEWIEALEKKIQEKTKGQLSLF